ncbi:MAG: SnoaL-like domain-containing protein [Chryseolinea sp.]
METNEIASKLAEYCRRGNWEGAHDELYAKDAESIEPYETPGYKKEVKGIEAIREKTEKFGNSVEKVNKIEVSETLMAGNSFAFKLTMDLVIKGKGPMIETELCVYEVKDGKVIREHFFV